MQWPLGSQQPQRATTSLPLPQPTDWGKGALGKEEGRPVLGSPLRTARPLLHRPGRLAPRQPQAPQPWPGTRTAPAPCPGGTRTAPAPGPSRCPCPQAPDCPRGAECGSGGTRPGPTRAPRRRHGQLPGREEHDEVRGALDPVREHVGRVQVLGVRVLSVPAVARKGPVRRRRPRLLGPGAPAPAAALAQPKQHQQQGDRGRRPGQPWEEASGARGHRGGAGALSPRPRVPSAEPARRRPLRPAEAAPLPRPAPPGARPLPSEAK